MRLKPFSLGIQKGGARPFQPRPNQGLAKGRGGEKNRRKGNKVGEHDRLNLPRKTKRLDKREKQEKKGGGRRAVIQGGLKRSKTEVVDGRQIGEKKIGETTRRREGKKRKNDSLLG